jgi:putative flippase GtrA
MTISVTAAQRRQLVRFGIVGLGSNLALYLVFVLLLNFAIQPLWAAAVCYGLGICASYIFNRAWAFESRDMHSEDLPKFLFAHGVGACSTLVVLNALLTFLRPEVAQLINIAVTAIVNYATLLVLGFGGSRAR